MDQVLDIRSDGVNRWQTQQKRQKQPSKNANKMCKTRAESSPARGVQVRRGKNPRQGESLDKDTNKQYNYEQDTPAGRLILS